MSTLFLQEFSLFFSRFLRINIFQKISTKSASLLERNGKRSAGKERFLADAEKN